MPPSPDLGHPYRHANHIGDPQADARTRYGAISNQLTPSEASGALKQSQLPPQRRRVASSLSSLNHQPGLREAAAPRRSASRLDRCSSKARPTQSKRTGRSLPSNSNSQCDRSSEIRPITIPHAVFDGPLDLRVGAGGATCALDLLPWRTPSRTGSTNATHFHGSRRSLVCTAGLPRPTAKAGSRHSS